jgi:hypothetical protein
MVNKLALVLKSKVALVAIGTLVVVAATATAVVAASNRGAMGPLAGTTPSPAHQCTSEKHATGHTTSSTEKDDRGTGDDRAENQHDLNGSITSIDTSNSSFVLKQCDGKTTTVSVSKRTSFSDGLRSFSDLKVGLLVEVEGSPQSNGTLAANSVHREENDSNDGSDGANADGGNHHMGTPAAGSGD